MEIPLTQGQVALVDADDFPRVNALRWYAKWSNGKTFYACRKERVDGKQRLVLLHRFIMGEPEGMHIDHWNGVTLDCRKKNLRVATAADNCRNRGRQANNTTGFKGVSLMKETGVFRADIELHGRQRYLGLFKASEEAAKAYDRAARRYFGEFARLNFPEEGEKSAAYVFQKRPAHGGVHPSNLVWVDIGGMTQLVTMDHPLARS
jgi:hypothetical protein